MKYRYRLMDKFDIPPYQRRKNSSGLVVGNIKSHK